MRKNIIFYVDIDDTLIRSFGTKRIPIVGVVAHVRNIFKEGATIYCWSSGGADYARSTAVELGIEECFVGFLPKPNVVIDDQSISAWRDLIEVHPISVPDEGVAGYRKMLDML